MYRYIWRTLPGPATVRVVLMTLAIAAVGFLLWHLVFPELAEWLTADDPSPVVIHGKG